MSKRTKSKSRGDSQAISFYEQDLVTCVHLNHKSSVVEKKKKDVYHGIYASQLYGTLFAIYGSFDISEEKNKCCHVKKISLKLLNYKGLFNIGFHQNSIKVDVTDKKNVIEIPLQALSKKYEMEILIKQPIRVEIQDFKRVVFRRFLYPIEEFGVDMGSQEKIANLKKLKSASIPNQPFFDTEFNYRDGVDYYDQLLHPGMAGSKSYGVFSERCLESNVNIAYF